MIYTEVLEDERDFTSASLYTNMTIRTEHIMEIYKEFGGLLAIRTTAEWLAWFDVSDIIAMPLTTLDALIEDPHLKATESFGVINQASEGIFQSIGVPKADGPTLSQSQYAMLRGLASIALSFYANWVMTGRKLVCLLSKELLKRRLINFRRRKNIDVRPLLRRI